MTIIVIHSFEPIEIKRKDGQRLRALEARVDCFFKETAIRQTRQGVMESQMPILRLCFAASGLCLT